MFTKSVKLVGVGGLDLFASNIGQLSLRNKRLSFSSDKLLLEDSETWRVWVFVLKMGNLVSDLLFPYRVTALVPENANPSGEEPYDLCLAAQKPQYCEHS